MCGGDGDARPFSHSTHRCILLNSALPFIYQSKALEVTESYLFSYTGLFEMIVGVLTTCHTHYTSDRSM